MTQPTAPSPSEPAHSLRNAAVVAGVVFGLLVLSAYGAWRHHFPYGVSHCCDLQVGLALRAYAAQYGGYLPAGEATPEASLSLLYPQADADLLRGKIVPEAAVQDRLDRGQRLTPETCAGIMSKACTSMTTVGLPSSGIKSAWTTTVDAWPTAVISSCG
jgi:hypothetical protein